MKIVQSFWSLPAITQQEENVESISARCQGGWLTANAHWMSWALSCLKLRQHYDQVELVTDKLGKAMLIDRLKLPYTKVTVCLDELANYPPKLWALGKLYAYSIQKEPFIHVDSDVFIWKKFGRDLESKGLITQSLENNREDFYKPLLQQTFQHLDYLPEVIAKYCRGGEDISAVNAGILGGVDLAFMKDYTDKAFSFVDRNLKQLHHLDMGEFNTVFEQVLFYYLAKEQDKQISYYFDRIEDGMSKLYFLNFLPGMVNFIHLIGMYKKYNNVCRQLEGRLAYEFPEYYRFLCRELKIPKSDQISSQINNLQYIYSNLKRRDKEFLFNIRFRLSQLYDFGVVNYYKPDGDRQIKERALLCNHRESNQNSIRPLSLISNEILLYFNKPMSCNDLFPLFRQDDKYNYLGDATLKTKIYTLIAYNYLFQDLLDLA